MNFDFPAATLVQVFEFIRNPRLPVFSNWVVDFNAFFETGVPVPVYNKARKIDSVLANGLESLPGLSGLMAILAQRTCGGGSRWACRAARAWRRFGVPPMTAAELTQGLPADEVALLNAEWRAAAEATPLWYYVLREAAVLEGGDQLGPVGARIVADTSSGC